MVPELIELAPQPAVVVRFNVVIGSMGPEFGRFLPDLQRRVVEKGGRPAGPAFTRYMRFTENGQVEVEAGFPVLEPVEADPPAVSIMLPGGRTATIAHVGPLESLLATHAILDEWLESSGRLTGGPRWEVYIADSASSRDATSWLVRLFQPLASL